MQPLFIATEKFGKNFGDLKAWVNYIKFSGLKHLDEVISLDQSLCPTVLPKIKPEYWPHIVNQDFMVSYFTDYEFLKKEAASIKEKNVLCVYKNPDTQPEPPPVGRFEFIGYDLVELETGISALLNCKGFPESFSNDELSSKGLLTTHVRAVEVQRTLRDKNPSEAHADCDLWAIFREMEG